MLEIYHDPQGSQGNSGGAIDCDKVMLSECLELPLTYGGGLNQSEKYSVIVWRL